MIYEPSKQQIANAALSNRRHARGRDHRTRQCPTCGQMKPENGFTLHMRHCGKPDELPNPDHLDFCTCGKIKKITELGCFRCSGQSDLVDALVIAGRPKMTRQEIRGLRGEDKNALLERYGGSGSSGRPTAPEMDGAAIMRHLIEKFGHSGEVDA